MSKDRWSRALIWSSHSASPVRERVTGGLSQAARAWGCAAAAWLLMGPGPVCMTAQISPGPLARAHQGLNGPGNCTRCHTASVRSRSFRCLDCHQEIAAELQQRRGLHATYPQGGAPGTACVKCHSDHNGSDFGIVHWTPTSAGFNHAQTGYALDGGHATVVCRDCHKPRNISAGARLQLKSKDLNHTYMGLDTRCASCHEDKHQGRLGADCARCHSTANWKRASLDEGSFDHAQTRFPLTGAHRQVVCAKCHTAGSDGQPRYAGISFATCAGCHADPHKGEFKQDCNSCHSTTTWKGSPFQAKFDHSRTSYPLLGKHLEVACMSCHNGGDFKSPVAHAACMDCHRTDPHGGQFAHRADGGRCEACHTLMGWRPSTFTALEHAHTGFALVRPHERLECAKCHIPAGAQTRFKIPYALCTACHEDAHEGQFAAAPWLNKCEKCHNGATFKSANFTLAQHQAGSFPLTGAHLAVACDQCHKPLKASNVARFHFVALTCATCHEDVHRGQFAGRMRARTSTGRAAGCEACHSTRDWRDLSRFAHDTTRFALLGTHRAVACSECHRPPNLERTMLHVRFDEATIECGGCHENPHAEQFGANAKRCETCHNTEKWRPSLFDHEKTSLSLKGGHQNVACSACHVNRRVVNGVAVLFYKPTPTQCADCHASGTPKPRTAAASGAMPGSVVSSARDDAIVTENTMTVCG